MKLINLKLQNFRQHANTEIRFPIDGLTGILGPNESGKTSIEEGIEWILFGADAIRGTMKGIRWTGAIGREVARGELMFEVGHKIYRAKRTENDAWLYEEGKESPIAKSLSGVNTMIPEILGMNLDEFSTTYLCRQKDLNKISSMGGTDRKQFVLGVMGVGKVDSALKSCRSRKNDLKNEVQGLKEGLGEREPLENELTISNIGVSESNEHVGIATENAEKAESAHQVAKQKLDESSIKQGRHRELEEKRSRASQQVEAADRELTRLQEEEKRAAEASERVQKADEQLKDLPVLREERDAIREAKARKSERERLEKSIESQKQDIRDLTGKINELNASVPEEPVMTGPIESKLAEQRDRLETLKNKRIQDQSTATQAAAAAEKERAKAQKQLDVLEPVGAEGECPTCERPLREKYNEVIAYLRAQVRRAQTDHDAFMATASEHDRQSDEELELATEIDELAARLEKTKESQRQFHQITERVAELQKDLDRKQKSIENDQASLAELPEASYSEERLQEVETRIRNLQTLEGQIKDDRILAGRTDSIQDDITRWEDQKKVAIEEISQISEAIIKLRFNQNAHTEIFTAAEKVREDLTGTKAALARSEEALKAAEDRSARAQKTLDDWDQRAERFKELQEDLRIHTQSSERLADFRTAVAASIRPELEELTSGFIHILTDGRHEAVTLSEEFDVILREGGLDVEVVSGGTEDITAIALRLAISQMIAARAGHPLSLLIFDEPFGSLDEVRRRNVIDLLERLKGTFEQVLVVTHVDEIKDTVDQVIHVEFDERGNRSRVTAEWITEEIETEVLAETAELIEEPA